MEEKVEIPEKKTTPKRDILDLPPLNLSDSETDSETEESAPKPKEPTPPVENKLPDLTELTAPEGEAEKVEELTAPVAAPSDSVWDSFPKDHKEEEKKEEPKETIDLVEVEAKEPELPEVVAEELPPPQPAIPPEELVEMIKFDHDYFNVPAHAPGEEPIDEPPMPVIEDFQIPGDTIMASFTEGIQLSPPRYIKKKRNDSSGSSSDSSSSSSDSDSSSCSCSSSNCSCGSGSSSSSSSSSSDSDSDNERKSRKLKKKLKKRAKAEQSMTNGLTTEHDNVEEEDQEPIDLGPPVLYFHESDLDTNESASDDEDFYDEHPRKPGVTRPPTLSSIFSPSITPAPTPPPSLENGVAGGNNTSLLPAGKSHSELKQKNKKKKRQSQHHSSPSEPPKKKRKDQWSPDAIYESNLRLFLQNQTKKAPPVTPMYDDKLGTELVDGSRSSNRKRVPKKFYGDSEDEESSQQGMFSPMMMVSTPPVVIRPTKKKSRSSSIMSESAPSTPVRPLSPREESESSRRLTDVIDFVALGYDGRTAEDKTYRSRPKLVLTLPTGLFSRYSQNFNESAASSSAEEEDSDGEAEPETPAQDVPDSVQSQYEDAIESFTRAHPSEIRQQDSKLYCYCRCPYDEVSEMIGCDSQDCRIEWFHFDCVGISVPPIGTWFCPECIKKQALAAA